MIILTPRSSRTRRMLFVVAITCLATSFASLFFVAASNDDNQYTAASSAPVKTHAAERFGKLPLSFELNTGQTNPSVKFLARGPGYDLFLTATDAVMTLRKLSDPDANGRESSVLRLKLIGANSTARVEGQD